MRIVITGNIGSGKSTVLNILQELKYKIINMDNITKQVFERKKEIIKNEFGTYDRKNLRYIVFNDKEKLKKLEDLVIPESRKILEDFIKNNKNSNIAIEIPLYFEKNLKNTYKYPVLLAYSPKKVCVKRAAKRDNTTEANIENIYNKQIDIEIKKEMSDIVIHTNKNILEIRKEIIKKLKLLETTEHKKINKNMYPQHN